MTGRVGELAGAYGIEQTENQVVLVYDLGGGAEPLTSPIVLIVLRIGRAPALEASRLGRIRLEDGLQKVFAARPAARYPIGITPGLPCHPSSLGYSWPSCWRRRSAKVLFP